MSSDRPTYHQIQSELLEIKTRFETIEVAERLPMVDEVAELNALVVRRRVELRITTCETRRLFPR